MHCSTIMVLFLHYESEWKNFESSMLEELMNCTKHFVFEQLFKGKLCCKNHDLLSVPIIFF